MNRPCKAFLKMKQILYLLIETKQDEVTDMFECFMWFSFYITMLPFSIKDKETAAGVIKCSVSVNFSYLTVVCSPPLSPGPVITKYIDHTLVTADTEALLATGPGGA